METTTELTPNEVRICRRYVGPGCNHCPVVVVPGARRPYLIGDSGYYTTPSGKTIVRSPQAYGWRTLYHPSTEEIRVGARWIARLRSVIAGRPLRWGAAFDNEIAVRTSSTTARRYRLRTLRTAGVAIRMPTDLRDRHGQWEHGRTFADCRREIAHKRRAQGLESIAQAVPARKARLFARVSRVVARYADARAAGFCDAGITAWCRARGIRVDSAVSLRRLLSDSDRSAQALALRIARRAIAEAQEKRAA